MKTKIISEIGINHNGDLDLCKKMIMASKVAGCNYVKIQKRNPDICVPENQKNKMKQTPWGEMTYLEYKHRMEFNEEQIKELIDYSNDLGIEFFDNLWLICLGFFERSIDQKVLKCLKLLITKVTKILSRFYLLEHEKNH